MLVGFSARCGFLVFTWLYDVIALLNWSFMKKYVIKWFHATTTGLYLLAVCVNSSACSTSSLAKRFSTSLPMWYGSTTCWSSLFTSRINRCFSSLPSLVTLASASASSASKVCGASAAGTASVETWRAHETRDAAAGEKKRLLLRKGRPLIRGIDVTVRRDAAQRTSRPDMACRSM